MTSIPSVGALSSLYSVSSTKSVTESKKDTESSSTESSSTTDEASSLAVLAQVNKVTSDILLEILENHGMASSSSSGSSGLSSMATDPAEMTSDFVSQSFTASLPDMFESFSTNNPDLSGDDLMAAFKDEMTAVLGESEAATDDMLNAISGGGYDYSTTLSTTFSMNMAALDDYVAKKATEEV